MAGGEDRAHHCHIVCFCNCLSRVIWPGRGHAAPPLLSLES